MYVIKYDIYVVIHTGYVLLYPPVSCNFFPSGPYHFAARSFAPTVSQQ
jgi:hypothetical protein